MTKKNEIGTLYVVATPIGNAEDITLRAMRVLQEVDFVICEERKEGIKLLRSLDISSDLVCLNEHNEIEVVQNILIDIMAGKSCALISDCGTPLFADPGKLLVTTLNQMNIKIVPIPGSSSLMASLSICPFPLNQFLFVGFLSPKSEQRIRELEQAKRSKLPLILMDTPYRMSRLLEDVEAIFGRKQSICLACDITLPKELILVGSVEEIRKRVSGLKKEFILILDKPQDFRRP
ncbi:MAG: 16S rRNA (cytidine(1402)-2'-O)-methyltransferase [Anaerolineaceae bacterium]|nr:16S rRNA (cytidine(1402)-2'-O)-methyltransferase [Anaerolineaceae bacterium]